MSGLGIIGRALAAGLSGAGEGMAAGVQQDMRDQSRAKEIEEMRDAEIAKSSAIAKYTNSLANAPADRAGALIRASAGERVPVLAGPVSNIDDSSAQAIGLPRGLSGNVADMRAKYSAMLSNPSATDAQKQNVRDVLAQIDAQAGAAQKQAQGAVDGQTRAHTPQELISLAYSSAVANGDVQVAAALKAMIPDKTLKIGKDEAIVDAANPSRVIFANTAGTDKERMKIEADRSAMDVKGRQEAILKAMQLDPLGINAPPGGYVKALSAGAGAQPSEQAPSGTIAERLQGKTGDAALAELPPPVAARVKAILDGRESFPSTARNNPRSAQLLDLAAQVDPGFDAINFNKRNQTAVAFAKGKQGDAVRAANQAIAHAGSLYDSIEKLNNFSGLATPLNWIVNPVQKAFGDERQGVFEQKAVAVASELRKVFAGSGGGSLAELNKWEESFPVSGSQAAQKAYLMSGMELLHGAVDNLQAQYENGMGKVDGTHSLITPKSQAILDKIHGRPTQAGIPNGGAPANSGVPSDISELLNKYGGH
jgi:hypothetical protein